MFFSMNLNIQKICVICVSTLIRIKLQSPSSHIFRSLVFIAVFPVVMQDERNCHLTVFQHIIAGCRPLWFQSKFMSVYINSETVLLFFAGNILISKCYYCRSESLCPNIPAIFIRQLNFADWCFILFFGCIYNRYIC